MGTKRPDGQNIRRTKRPSDKMEKPSVETKRPWGQNVRGQKVVRLGHIYQGLARQFLLKKIYEREGQIRQYIHSLCGKWGGGGGLTCTVLNTEVLYIYKQNSSS